METVYDLAWGDPLIVRQALAETLGTHFLNISQPLSQMGYTNHLGSPKLIEQMKDLAERQSGHRPKHLMVTCGATGAINAALYALKELRTEWVLTNKKYYPIYPSIINVNGLIRRNVDEIENFKKDRYLENTFLTLTDSPSAPEGLVFPFQEVDIWDGAYAGKTYSSGGHVPQKYRVMCGSLSKTLGLSGLRLGWIGTDEDDLIISLSQYITASYIGLSCLSIEIAENILSCINLDRFEKKSSNYLNYNREEMQRLLTRFGQGDVPSRGMFAIVQLGKLERKALEKANIKWQFGSSWGESDDWARLSLGQTKEVTKQAVRAALK